MYDPILSISFLTNVRKNKKTGIFTLQLQPKSKRIRLEHHRSTVAQRLRRMTSSNLQKRQKPIGSPLAPISLSSASLQEGGGVREETRESDALSVHTHISPYLSIERAGLKRGDKRRESRRFWGEIGRKKKKTIAAYI